MTTQLQMDNTTERLLSKEDMHTWKARKNSLRISSHVRNRAKVRYNVSTGKNVETLETSAVAGGVVKWGSHLGKPWQFHKG